MRCKTHTKNNTRCKLPCVQGLSTCSVHTDTCSICLDKLKNIQTLHCGHSFHRECIQKHFEYDSRCPMCRANTKLTIHYDNDLPEEQELFRILRQLNSNHLIRDTVYVRMAYVFYNDTGQLVAALDQA